MNIKKHIFYISVLVGMLLLVASCGGNKKLSGKAEKGTIIPQQAIKMEDYYKQVLVYKSFTGKANLHIVTPQMNQKVIANIKMNHAKDIWSSVAAMGGVIEAARAYITPDSLKALLPLSKDAYSLSFQEGLDLLQTDLEFISLQNLFLGNPLLTGKRNVKPTILNDSTIQVEVLHDGYLLTIHYNKATQLIQEQSIINNEKKFFCKILQSNYKPLADKQPFAFARKIIIESNGVQTSLDLDFSKAEIDIPNEIKFRIPDSYTIIPVKKA